MADFIAMAREFAPSSREFKPGDRINYAERVYGEAELALLFEAASEFWLTSGRLCRRFEAGLKSYLGHVERACFVNSGSSANLLAFMSLTSPSLGDRRIRRGDEVIAAAACFPTTVAPIMQYGAVPVFVDAELPSCNAKASAIEAAITKRTRAIFLAHTLGNPFDISEIMGICARHGIWLIEDNCDALGSQYYWKGEWRMTGTFGDVATSSFYPAHHITTGEGGAVYTRHPEHAALLASLRDWGRDCSCESGSDNSCGRRFSGQHGSLPLGYDHKYVYSQFGYNLKATELQAAIGCAQLARLPKFVEARRRNWFRLRDALSCLEDVFMLPESSAVANPSWFGFALIVRSGAPFARNAVMRHLESKGIQTRALFAGNIVRHPCFSGCEEGRDYRVPEPLDNSDIIAERAFWIGVHPGLDDARVDYMASAIAEFAKSK